jgi:O-antigen/teichoic acid export membrane protein
MSQRAYGALLSYASIFINMAIALLFTPYMVSCLGQNEYGLFNIIGSFTAYLVVLDMGLNDSVIRYLMRYHKQNNPKAMSNFLANTLVFYAMLSLIVFIAGMILYMMLDVMFHNTLTPTQIDELKIMAIIITLNAALTVLLNPIGAYITSKQRFVFLNSSTIILRVLTTIVLVVSLYLGYKAVAVVAITAILNISLLFIKIYYAFHIGMKVKLKAFYLSHIAKLLKYSAPIFIVVLTEMIYWKLDNILLAHKIGAAVVAVYAIGMMFHKYFMSFSTAISKVMMPKIILDIDKGADALALEQTLTKISRMQGMGIMLILSGLVLYGTAFIQLWLGESYIGAYYVMMWTLLPYSFELMGNVRNIFLQVNHLYWYRAGIIFTISILNIFLTLYLIDIYGLVGAAMSTGVAVVFGYIAVNVVLWKKLHINVARYMKNLASGIWLALSIAMVVAYSLSCQIDSWSMLLLHISLYTLLYVVLFRYIAMNDEEVKNMKIMIESIKNKIQG